MQLFQISILTTLMLFHAGSFASTQIEIAPGIIKLKKAKTWNKAKRLCKKLGQEWDLPSSHREFVYSGLLEKMNIRLELKNVKAGSAGMSIYHGPIYPLWISKSESFDEEYFEGTSNFVFMQDGAGMGEELFDISKSAMRGLKNYRKELNNKHQTEDFRTEEEMDIVYSEIKRINERDGVTGKRSFNLNFPRPNIFSDEVNAILRKPQAERYISAIDNLDKVMKAYKDGLDVFCVKVD